MSACSSYNMLRSSYPLMLLKRLFVDIIVCSNVWDESHFGKLQVHWTKKAGSTLHLAGQSNRKFPCSRGVTSNNNFRRAITSLNLEGHLTCMSADNTTTWGHIRSTNYSITTKINSSLDLNTKGHEATNHPSCLNKYPSPNFLHFRFSHRKSSPQHLTPRGQACRKATPSLNQIYHIYNNIIVHQTFHHSL